MNNIELSLLLALAERELSTVGINILFIAGESGCRL
jgi:hypothetical protein